MKFAVLAEESGRVHSTVRERWAARDPELIQGMAKLGEYADRAKQMLETRNFEELGTLMDLNFAMRRKLYGDNVVGALNIAAVELANEIGFAAKFTGSGGAILCLFRADCNQWYVHAALRFYNLNSIHAGYRSPLKVTLRTALALLILL
jgi:mevalonate kinase